VPCRPAQCRRCGTAFPPDSQPARQVPHRVVELPPIRAQITEYQVWGCACAACGTRTWGALPAGTPRSGFGPRLQACAAVLAGSFGLSRRQVGTLLEELWGARVSLGALSHLEQRTVAALAPVYTEAGQATAAASVVHVDETSWREKGKRPWLWLAATAEVAYFRVADGRTRAAFTELLPPERGPDLPLRRVISDRFSSYAHLEPWRRGLCWAHLKRDFQACVDQGGAGVLAAHWALDELRKLFGHWHAFKTGGIDRSTLQERVAPVQQAFSALLELGARCGCRKTAALCHNLLQCWDGLWTFVREEGVEPTNNHAERCLRRAVLWRKSSFGTQSERGRRFVESMLTVTLTLRLQHRRVLDYVEAACRAALTQTAPPALLPA
jgi:transposase